MGHFTTFDHSLYFTVQDGGTIHLWKTDGTESGTVVVPLDE